MLGTDKATDSGSQKPPEDYSSQGPGGLTNSNPLAIVTQSSEVVPPIQSQTQKNTNTRDALTAPAQGGFGPGPILCLPRATTKRHTTSTSSPPRCTPLCEELAHSQLYHLSGPRGPPRAHASRTAHQQVFSQNLALNSLGPVSTQQLKRPGSKSQMNPATWFS